VAQDEFLLDIGSGYGRVLEYLRERGFKRIVGLEPDFRFLENRNLPVVCGKGEQAPFKDGCFGAVCLIGVLSYILGDSKRTQLITEINRILKKGALFFLSCFLISEDKYHRKKYREGHKEYGKYGIFESDSGGIFRHSNEEELKSLLNPFDILSWKLRPFTTMNRRPASGAIIEAQKP
jgi:SAM-dependent methyltransferase